MPKQRLNRMSNHHFLETEIWKLAVQIIPWIEGAKHILPWINGGEMQTPKPKHPFHLVDLRPWPIFRSLGTCLLTLGLTRWMNRRGYEILAVWGIAIILFRRSQWWRDISREGTFRGNHTSKVEYGLRIGILLFITREIFFFFSFFWAFFHSSLSPNRDTGAVWPPTGLYAINPYEVPLLNTTLLLSRGATITWAHIAILNSLWIESCTGLVRTVVLGLLFTSLQVLEYHSRSFSITDSVYGRTFFVATGFHGLHVLMGTIFIIVAWLRQWNNHFSHWHHFGFEASAWYWHFVDVVWLFLFVSFYWWAYQ